MKGKFYARCAVAAVALIGAACVASTGHDGWGWLLFVGIIVTPTIES